MRRIVALLSDTHGGNELGLLNPATVLLREAADGGYDEWHPQLTATQRYLWECYQQDINSVMRLAGSDDIVLLVVGDLTQGIKYPTLWVSNRVADQTIIARDVLLPWLDMPNVATVRLAKGTGSHELGEGSATMTVYELLRAQYAEKDIRPLYHGLANVGGVRIDYAHHGPGAGIREWTRGNQIRYYLRSLMLSERRSGRTPPDIVARAHYHTWAHEIIQDEWAGQTTLHHMFLLPSYCGMGDHGHQATRSAWLQTHGLLALEIEDGALTGVHPFKRTIDLRTEEEL